ncbi:hypothetical protein VNI00_016750 [Paramarasmius palmivorus]|uniref:Uncharacterized protein n=1 Tax=Paramarasmius palmivorus TaxID=297713 RepID=A0AAW0BDX8_9AGAR
MPPASPTDGLHCPGKKRPLASQTRVAKASNLQEGDATLTREITRLNLDVDMLRHLKRTAEARQHDAENELARARNSITELERMVEEHERENRALFENVKAQEEDVKARDDEISKLRDYDFALGIDLAQAKSLLDSQNQYIRALKSSVEFLWKCDICEEEYSEQILPVTLVVSHVWELGERAEGIPAPSVAMS